MRGNRPLRAVRIALAAIVLTLAVPGAASAETIQSLEILTPAAIAGSYEAGGATFGPQAFTVTAQVVQALDGANSAGPTTTDACSTITNPSEIEGRIAAIDRGGCPFVTKVILAQQAGAIGVIILDNQPGPVMGMGGLEGSIVIPSLRVTLATGNLIKGQLSAGELVTATLQRTPDLEAPTITHPGDFTVETPAGDSSAVVTYMVTATDNSGTATVVCTPASGSTLPLGPTTVSCTATDPSDNASTVSFVVTLVPECLFKDDNRDGLKDKCKKH